MPELCVLLPTYRVLIKPGRWPRPAVLLLRDAARPGALAWIRHLVVVRSGSFASVAAKRLGVYLDRAHRGGARFQIDSHPGWNATRLDVRLGGQRGRARPADRDIHPSSRRPAHRRLAER